MRPPGLGRRPTLAFTPAFPAGAGFALAIVRTNWELIMTNAGSIRHHLVLLLPLAAGLAATGCYEGSELTAFSDARRPIELDNDEMFGELAPAAPPFESEVSEDFSSAEEDPSAIYGGTTVPVCGWPSTVELGGACSGTLVHPQVVIYAAHCGASYSKIYFGENYQAPAKTVTPSFCKIIPGGNPGSGNDFAVCKLSAPVTNVPITVMPPTEVIAKYHDLWHVEKSFRMSKSDLRGRPMFHHTRAAIEAHLTIVFTALAVAHAIQSRTGLSIAKVVKQLRPLRSATININGTTQTFPPAIPDAQRQILTDLGHRIPFAHGYDGLIEYR